MSSNPSWARMTLKDAGVVLIDCDHRTPAAAEDGYPYIAIPQLKGGHISLEGVRRISHADFTEWTKKLKPQEDDVIVVRRCNSGDSAVVPAGLECAIGQNLVVLRADGEKIYPRFLRWLVQSPDWWDQVAKYINVGAVFDSLKCKEIPYFELTIPPMRDQVEISVLLGALDDRITLLRETNATLEAIAQALFKSWFVDFDPVHAKAEGRQPEGMDAATAALFPDSFEEFESGLVPKGWTVGVLGDVVNIKGGKQLEKEYFDDLGENPIFGGAGIMGRTDLKNAHGFVITVGRVGAYCGQFFWHLGDAWVNNNSSHIQAANAKQSVWVYQWLRATNIDHIKKGAAQPFVSNGDLADLKMVLPINDLVDRFVDIICPIYERMAFFQEQVQVLTKLRDTLLPRLISGQVKLPEEFEL